MDRSIAHWRLRNQRLCAPHATSAREVLETLLCVQAENPSQSAWAVAARTTAPDAADLAGLLDSGEVARTHVLRPTWHYVGRADLDWLLALTGAQVRKVTGGQLLGELGLLVPEVERLQALVLELLDARAHRTRAEVTEALRAGAPELAERVTGRVVMLLMGHLEADRLVCSGSPRDGEHTYATWADRVGARVPLEAFDRDEALARLALRYFTGHGPATVKDLAYWATLTLTDVRRGVEAVRERLESFEHDGRTFWHAPGESAPAGTGRPAAHLLQLLDETYRGYQDSRWVLDEDGVVARGREAAIGMALVDGQLVAGMKRTLARTTVRFELSPHRPLDPGERRAIDEAARRYAGFLGLAPEVVVAGS